MASERLSRMLRDLLEEIREREESIAPLKVLANSLAGQQGLDGPFPDVKEGAARAPLAIRPDEFAHHPAPSPAARAYLEWRKERGLSAASLDEIYEALHRGGYPFEDNKDEGSIKNGLKIALAKDRQVSSLRNGHYGLAVWYGSTIDRRRSKHPALAVHEPDEVREPPADEEMEEHTPPQGTKIAR